MDTAINKLNGDITAYGFACGYIQEHEKDNIRTTLEKDGVYHVKRYDHNKKERKCWLSFENLTEARKEYAHQCSISKYEAYIHLGEGSGPFLTEEIPLKIKPIELKLPLSGYGKDIPSQFMAYYWDRWRRVYLCNYGNSGSHYIKLDSKDVAIQLVGEY